MLSCVFQRESFLILLCKNGADCSAPFRGLFRFESTGFLQIGEPVCMAPEAAVFRSIHALSQQLPDTVFLFDGFLARWMDAAPSPAGSVYPSFGWYPLASNSLPGRKIGEISDTKNSPWSFIQREFLYGRAFSRYNRNHALLGGYVWNTVLLSKTSSHCLHKKCGRMNAPRGTIENYVRHVRAFAAWMGGNPATKETAAAWKEHLLSRKYSPRHHQRDAGFPQPLFRFPGVAGVQGKTPAHPAAGLFREESKELTREEYQRLLAAARALGRERLELLMETICATGHPRQRGEVYHRGGACLRKSGDFLKRENQNHPDPRGSSAKS